MRLSGWCAGWVVLAILACSGGCARYRPQEPYAASHPARPEGAALPVELPRIPVVDFVGQDFSGLPPEPPTWGGHVPMAAHAGHGGHGEAEPETGYVCPMHPEVRSDAPGRCPECEMKLVPGEKKAEPDGAYVCPMHPEVRSDGPGRCPKCGMNLRLEAKP